MTAGQPARIYRTDDGGESFELVHESPHAAAFFDSLDFWDEERGLIFSDPVEGRFLVLETRDAGKTWQEIPPAAFPPPEEGEAGFAASGSNLAVGPGGLAWIGTGGSAARILTSRDFGESWQGASTPVLAGIASAGIFSVAFRDPQTGLAAGGDYQSPEDASANLARSTDGGASWKLVPTPPPSGHRAAVSPLPGHPTPVWISVGRGGCDVSRDDGLTWETFSDEGFYTLALADDGTLWAAGSDGRAAKLTWEDQAL